MTVNDKLKKEVRELNQALNDYEDRNHYLTLKLKDIQPSVIENVLP